ncbi:MAG: peptide chain release factor N(5)-glutamine methyltransferase [Candidatus Saccharibacteria bacterium]
MPAIKDWISTATTQLSVAEIISARLDAEVLLACAINKDRTYLHAHPEQILDDQQTKDADGYLVKRLNRIPSAYITGYKEFYGRNFTVTPATLIPRPESEDIITILKSIVLPYSNSHIPIANLIDIGTGSGCLGITAKLEFPNLDITLTDISAEALEIASLNAKKLSANVSFLQNDLLKKYKGRPDIIIANLPYVDRSWKRSPETNYEPTLALFADDGGKALINKLIIQASKIMSPGSYLIIEADPEQHQDLINYARQHSFTIDQQANYILVFKHQ